MLASIQKELILMKSAVGAFLVAISALLPCAVWGLDVETNNVHVVLGGDYPVLTYDQNSVFSFEVRSWGASGWWIRSSAVRGECYVYAAEVGEQVLDAPFDAYHSNSHDSGPNVDVFRFQFRWSHTFSQATGGTTTQYHYGWVSLVTNQTGGVEVLASQVADMHGQAVVGQGEPGRQAAPSGPSEDLPAAVAFKYDEYADHVDLATGCVPVGTTGYIAIPETINGKPVRGICDNAFGNCSYITRIDLSTNITSVAACAFSGCSSLKELVIPQAVTNIGKDAVRDCTSLGRLQIDTLACPESAFRESSITNLVLSDGVEEVPPSAFSGCCNLAAVRFPASLARIGSRAFYDTPSLTSVTVPWAAIIEDDAFPPGCKITRSGPDIILPGDLGKPDDETKSALARTLDWRDYASKLGVNFIEYHDGAGDPEPRSAIYACAHLGVSPAAMDDEEREFDRVAYYKMPSVRILGIDPINRVITGQVVPAEGSRIVSTPLVRAFGFTQIVFDPDDHSKTYDGDDFGYRYLYGEDGFSADFHDYVSSNGVFRLSYPEWAATMKDPQPAHLFKILLWDRRRALWK